MHPLNALQPLKIWSILHRYSAVKCEEVIALGGRRKKVGLDRSDYLALHNVADHIEKGLLVSYRDSKG